MFSQISSSPLQPLSLSDGQGTHLEAYIKRDDLLHPYAAGPKYRKVVAYLEEAKKQRFDKVAGCGGPSSNHLLAIAALGCEAGLQTRGVVRGLGPDTTLLTRCQQLGMRLTKTFKNTYANSCQAFADDPTSLWIPEGGLGDIGIDACSSIVDELADHLPQAPPWICTTVGTATTALGLMRGIARYRWHTRLLMVPPFKDCVEMERMLLSAANHLNVSCRVYKPQQPWRGFAKAEQRLDDIKLVFEGQSGIKIDSVYQPKMIYALMEWITQGLLEPGGVIIHCGGVW